MRSKEEKAVYLSENHPDLYILLMKKWDKKEEIKKYMAKCKRYEDEIPKYSFYIRGYWLPYI